MKLASEPTVALAETDAMIRENVIRALEDDFKLVLTTEPGSGKTAVLLQTAHLMIYDLKLGINDLRSLRNRYPEMPIVLITPKGLTTVLDEALQLDRTDFITQPVNSKELRIRINQCLRKWRLRQAHVDKGIDPIGAYSNDFVAGKHPAPGVQVSMPELHSNSGRVNAAAIARYLDVPLSELAGALKVNYTALHKTPDSLSAQAGLSVFKRILVILAEMLGAPKKVRAWLNSPHPDLGQRSPIAVMLEGHSDAVLTILENALAGVSS